MGIEEVMAFIASAETAVVDLVRVLNAAANALQDRTNAILLGIETTTDAAEEAKLRLVEKKS